MGHDSTVLYAPSIEFRVLGCCDALAVSTQKCFCRSGSTTDLFVQMRHFFTGAQRAVVGVVAVGGVPSRVRGVHVPAEHVTAASENDASKLERTFSQPRQLRRLPCLSRTRHRRRVPPSLSRSSLGADFTSAACLACETSRRVAFGTSTERVSRKLKTSPSPTLSCRR